MKGWADFRAAKEAVSLEAVLRHYQVPELRRRRDQLVGRCPIHQGTRDDSFRAHLGKNAFRCFACQAGGNVLDFVAAMEKCSIHDAALWLQQWFGASRSLGPAEGPQLTRWPQRQPELVREKESYNAPLPFALRGVDPNHSYLEHRGLARATVVEFGVGFYGRPGLLSQRIVIPIQNQRGQIVAYAGRAVDGGPPKYKLPAGFRKGLELFNSHRAIATCSRTVVVVEGYFDCMRVHQAGFSWVVALMGASLSIQQERLLLAHFEELILMLDGDAAGHAASQVIAARLSGRCSVATVRLSGGAQPDQMSDGAIRRLLADSV
jgi:DNA primase